VLVLPKLREEVDGVRGQREGGYFSIGFLEIIVNRRFFVKMNNDRIL
jgi:hypothetical protein